VIVGRLAIADLKTTPGREWFLGIIV